MLIGIATQAILYGLSILSLVLFYGFIGGDLPGNIFTLYIIFMFLLDLMGIYVTVLGWYGKFTLLGLMTTVLIMVIPFVTWLLVPYTGKGITALIKNKPRVLNREPSVAGLIIIGILCLIFLAIVLFG